LFEEYLNLKVVVIKKDGYKKAGIVRSCDADFIKIEKDDGRSEHISHDSIESITEAKT